MKFKLEVREDISIYGKYTTDEDLIKLGGLYKSPILEVEGEKSIDELLEYGLRAIEPYIAHMRYYTTRITTFNSVTTN